jgi:hypothetical protein
MTVVTIKGKINEKGELNLKHPSFSPEHEVEVTVVMTEKYSYDFSDLAGKLSWKGDGLSEQKKLRNEWE